MIVQELRKSTARDVDNATPAPFFVRGKVLEGTGVRHKSRDLGVDFLTPTIDLDALITLRTEPGPLFDVKLNEILDFLVETGERMKLDKNGYLREAVDRISATNVLPRSVIDQNVRMAADYLNKAKLLEYAEQNLGDAKVLDEWVSRVDSTGRRSFTRAFPPRLIHVLPGNSPVVSVQSIALGAMVKAVNLFKMGSSDPFMAVAILRTMLDVDPDHPVPRSMSAVYWRGGDESGGAGDFPAAVFRQDRGLGRRRCDQQRHQVFDARPAAGLIRSEDLNLDDRDRSLRLRRDPGRGCRARRQ